MIQFEKTGKFDVEDPDEIYCTKELSKKISEITAAKEEEKKAEERK